MKAGFGKRMLTVFVSVCLILFGTGCGEAVPESLPEDVALLEPVDVPDIYETAAVRNLYQIKSYSGNISPYVEEYSFENGQSFAAYAAYPGEHVKRGGALVDTDTESIDTEIEKLEKSVAEADEIYQEYRKEADERLYELEQKDAEYSKIMDNFEEQKPDEFVDIEQPDGAEGKEPGGNDPKEEEPDRNARDGKVPNPEYEAWDRDRLRWEGEYCRNLQSLLECREELRQRGELYDMDHAYSLSRLEHLKEQRGRSRLLSGMAGNVAALRYCNAGDYIPDGVSVMAVGDMNRKRIRCEFISASAIRTAKDVYALIDGERYEIEYEPMGADEYARLKSRDGAVYTTFYFRDDVTELPVGAYCTVVVVTNKREQVLTVTESAVHSEGMSYYVYLEKDGERIYTPVTTGYRDGYCVEILSGLSEGDRVKTDKAYQHGENTVVLERGTIDYGFSSTGFLYYPDTVKVTNPVENGTCYVTECDLTIYQRVKKGEVLAKIRVVPDQLAYERLNTSLKRERERLADLIREGGNKNNEKAARAKRERIVELEEQIRRMDADAAVTSIISPIDGVVIEPAMYEREQLIGSGAFLCVIADETRCYVVVDDADSQLNYGDVLEIGYSAFGTEKTVQGTVLTVNQRSLSADLKSTEMLISVPKEAIPEMAYNAMYTGGFWNRRSFTVTGRVRSVSNVVLVPKSAVTLGSGGTYVDVVRPDGSVVSQGFVAGGSDNAYYWVIEGLLEGTKICTK